MSGERFIDEVALPHVPDADGVVARRFLHDVAVQASHLPASERRSLVADLVDHIDDAFASPWPGPIPVTIHHVLDELGSPNEIVDSATAWSSAPSGSPGGSERGPSDDGRGDPSREESLLASSNGATYDAFALGALTVGFFVIPTIGWLVGLVLVWLGPRWSTAEKVLATVLWPVTVALPIICATLLPDPLANPVALVVLAVVLLAWWPYVVVRLVRASALSGRLLGSARTTRPGRRGPEEQAA